MPGYGYKDLRVWQVGMTLAEKVYKVTNELPSSERFSLSDQLKRSAISIPSNIAEGQKRLNRKETIQFYGIALGSDAELETQLLLVSRLYGLPVNDELVMCADVGKMLTGLIKVLKNTVQPKHYTTNTEHRITNN